MKNIYFHLPMYKMGHIGTSFISKSLESEEEKSMDFDKMKQWMEVTQKYQNNKFWDMIFEQSPPEEMMDDFENPTGGQKLKAYSSKNFPETDIVLD